MDERERKERRPGTGGERNSPCDAKCFVTMMMRAWLFSLPRNSEHRILLHGAATTPRRARLKGQADGGRGSSGVSRRAMRVRGNHYPRGADANGTGKGYRDRGCLALSKSHVSAFRKFTASLRLRGGTSGRRERKASARQTTGEEEREYITFRAPPLLHHQHNHITRARVFPDTDNGRRTCPTVATQLTRSATPRSLADRTTLPLSLPLLVLRSPFQLGAWCSGWHI